MKVEKKLLEEDEKFLRNYSYTVVENLEEKAKGIAFPYTKNISGDARVSDFYYP